MNRRWFLGPILAVGVLVTAACGSSGDDEAAGGSANARRVEVKMVDIAFEPETLEVAAGETVRFVFANEGAGVHDAFVGDAAAQAAHESEMRAAEEHGGGHGSDDSDSLTVDPGKTEEMVYTFRDSGMVEIGCHQPGHYAAGMKIAVTVR